MRIVGGKHRGRVLSAPPGRGLRPTADRVREAAFNILAHGGYGDGGTSPIADARVLDAFCGTGAMGLEALSRGARHASFLDNSPDALAACRANVAALREQANADILSGDVFNPPRPPEPCALIFLDPPYGEGMASPALAALDRAGWIAGGALVIVELSAREMLQIPDGFETLDERRYGAARLVFLRRLDTA